MAKRKLISSGNKWEILQGYSRAIRVGNIIEISGTTAIDGDQIMFQGDAYNQTHYVLLQIQQTLEDAGARIEDVIRTRIYITDMEQWELVGKAHGEVFRDIRPAMTVVEVYSLPVEGLIVEIEATAFIQDNSDE